MNVQRAKCPVPLFTSKGWEALVIWDAACQFKMTFIQVVKYDIKYPIASEHLIEKSIEPSDGLSDNGVKAYCIALARRRAALFGC